MSSYRQLGGNSLQYPLLLRVKRGDDFFREDFGGAEEFDAQDIPRIAELDSNAWGDFH